MKFMKFSFLILNMLCLNSCFRTDKDIGSLNNPVVIGLSYPYYQNLSELDFIKLKNRIESDLKMHIEFRTIKDSIDILEEIGKKKIDIAFLSLNEYLIAREYYRVEPKLRILRENGKNSYYGVIVTLSSDIINIEKLNGKKIATRSPYSISGFVLPSIIFSRLKVKPLFVFMDSFEIALEKLKNGEVDAVSVYKKMIEKEKSLKIIYEFGPIPNEPVICRKGLDELICGRVLNEFMKLSNDKDYSKIILKMADITGFEEIKALDYKELHETILNYSDKIYTLIPDGIKIKKLSEEYRID
ncbi:MAG: PhnD/SsuA/transferrin family substrate-binding protein [Elusimicrobiales bacterium]|nr:PhnD/SsuA/transferrin family substrate-binding protein [Elusimicrobiales bacterium]